MFAGTFMWNWVLKLIHYQNIQMLQVLFGFVSNNTYACVINLQSTSWEWQIFDPLVKSTQKTETTCWEERYIVQSFKQSQVNLQCFRHAFLQLQQASMSMLFLKKEKNKNHISPYYSFRWDQRILLNNLGLIPLFFSLIMFSLCIRSYVFLQGRMPIKALSWLWIAQIKQTWRKTCKIV